MKRRALPFITAIVFASVIFFVLNQKPSSTLTNFPDPLSEAVAKHSPRALNQYIQTAEYLDKIQLVQFASKMQDLQRCWVWQKDCQQRNLNAAFATVQSWAERHRYDILVQAQSVAVILVLADFLRQYQIEDRTIYQYASDFSKMLLDAYPDNEQALKAAIFVQKNINPESDDFKNLLSKCLALDSIKGYCQTLAPN